VSDASVRAALRSDEMLVVIEAPAGCGKTHQGADYALEMAGTSKGRLLILTHTHAACSVFAERTRGVGSLVEIRTIDSLISQVANAYHDVRERVPNWGIAGQIIQADGLRFSIVFRTNWKNVGVRRNANKCCEKRPKFAALRIVEGNRINERSNILGGVRPLHALSYDKSP
jgi:CRISPR/Cas system-associated endonuclease/helicase Cas3